jgi:hypothetical protein
VGAGYSLNTWAIHQIAASNVALYYCLQALMIALFAWLMLGEQLTVRVGIGGLLIMAGLLTVTWSLERQRKKDAAKAMEIEEDEEDEEDGSNKKQKKKSEMTPLMAKEEGEWQMKTVDDDKNDNSLEAWGGDKEATAQWQDVESGGGGAVSDIALPTSPPAAGETKKAGETDNYGTFV